MAGVVTAYLLQAAAFLAGLAAQHVWLRHRLRRRLHALLIVPLLRRARRVRRTLAALDRAAHLRPYRPTHHTSRTQP